MLAILITDAVVVTLFSVTTGSAIVVLCLGFAADLFFSSSFPGASKSGPGENAMTAGQKIPDSNVTSDQVTVDGENGLEANGDFFHEGQGICRPVLQAPGNDDENTLILPGSSRVLDPIEHQYD